MAAILKGDKSSNPVFKIYPYNLAYEIFEYSCRKDELEQMEIDAQNIYVPGLIEAIKTLTESEQFVIKCRYERRLSLAETGKEIDRTVERMRQVLAKAIRKLRHPSRCNKYRMVTMEQHREELKSQQDEISFLHKRIEGLADLLRSADVISEDQRNDIMNMNLDIKFDISEIGIDEAGFTVRTYNALYRKGFTTIADVAELTEEDLYHVRNLGKKSVDEVIEIMKRKYGVTIKKV